MTSGNIPWWRQRNNLILGCILLFSVLIRVIIAATMEVGHDEMIFSTRGMGFISSGQLSTLDQSPLYFYTLNVIYNIFGYTIWSFRILDIFSAGLTVLVLFLIGKELYNEKAGLWCAFLFGISSFAVLNNKEMDTVAVFLVTLSFLFLLKGFKYPSYLYASAATIGVGFLFKPLAILVLPLYSIYFIKYYKKRKNWLKIIGICTLILCFLLMPIAAHNYLAFTQKGVVDFWTSQVFRINVDVYQGFGSGNSGFFGSNPYSLLQNIIKILRSIMIKDPVNVLLPIFGFVVGLLQGRKERMVMCIVSSLLLFFAFINVTGSNHNLFFLPFLATLSAQSLRRIERFAASKASFTFLVVLIIIILNVNHIGTEISKETPHRDLRTYVAENIPENALVLFDSRINRFAVGWALHDRYFLPTTSYRTPKIVEVLVPGTSEVPFFFVACAVDECGQRIRYPTLRQQIASITETMVSGKLIRNSFKTNSLVKRISKNSEDYIDIYEGKAYIDTQALELIAATRSIYYYPFGWRIKVFFDAYTPVTITEKMVFSAGRSALHYSFVLFLCLVVLTLYLARKSIAFE